MSETKHDGLPVSGYKPQFTAKIDLVNRNKEIEERVLRVLDDLRSLPPGVIDPRWLATGRTDIEKGFMSVNRAVFQPVRVHFADDEQGA